MALETRFRVKKAKFCELRAKLGHFWLIFAVLAIFGLIVLDIFRNGVFTRYFGVSNDTNHGDT